MAATLPAAAVFLVATLLLVPGEEVTALRHQALMGIRGPMRVLPELDIQPEEESERRLTAAPRMAMPVDFVAVELDYALNPEAEKKVPEPRPLLEAQDPVEVLTSDNVQDAIRTTGLPVPAQSELEVLHVARPLYPREAVRREIEGRVTVMLLVGRDGSVSQTYVLDPGRFPLLETAAREAARRYVFRPYTVDGKTTPFWVRLPFDFHLVG